LFGKIPFVFVEKECIPVAKQFGREKDFTIDRNKVSLNLGEVNVKKLEKAVKKGSKQLQKIMTDLVLDS